MIRPNVKQCPGCKKWRSLDELLTSPEFRPEGINIDNEENEYCLYFFTHVVASCNSTFAVPVEEFREFIAEPISNEIVSAAAGCKHRCTRITDLAQCDADCGLAPFRRFILNLKLAKEKRLRRSSVSVANQT